MKPRVYVDLDGTLSPSDVLLEACFLLLRRNPLYALALLWWACQGAWALKQAVFARVQPNMALLPIRPEVLEAIQQYRAQGHAVVLASASPLREVQALATHLGVFDGVLASTTHNLKSEHKLRAIQDDLAKHHTASFIYMGDALADLPIWNHAQTNAGTAVVVAPGGKLPWRLRRALGQAIPSHFKTLAVAAPRWGQLWRLLRPWQWAKNTLLFVPLLAAHQHSLLLWGGMALGFVAFGCVASATYVLNDLLDLEADRAHPRKRSRPLASAALPLLWALPCALVLAALGGALAYAALGLGFALVLLAYASLTLLYSWVLKRIAFVDVLALAMLYTLRVVAGAVGASLSLSSWLVAVSLFVFLSLALVKRCTELEYWVRNDEAEHNNEAEQQEPPEPQNPTTAMPGRGYQMGDLGYLVSMGISSGFVAVLVLALYVDSPNVTLLYSTPEYLWGICPLFLYWLMRIWILVSRQEMKDDPVHFALGDRVSWCLLLAFALLFALAL